MTISKYSAQVHTVSIKLVKRHELNQIIGNRQLDLYLRKEIQQYGGVLQAVAVKEDEGESYHIVCNYEVVEKALADQAAEVELLVVDCPFNDAPRIANLHTAFSNRKDTKDCLRLISYLKNHLKRTEEGKRWRQDLPGKDTRAKIAKLLGYGDGSSVHKLEVIGTEPEILDAYINKDLKLEEAYKEAAAAKKAKKAGMPITVKQVNPKRENEAPPEALELVWTSDTTITADTEHTSTATAFPQYNDPVPYQTMPTYCSTSTDPADYSSSTKTPLPYFAPATVQVFVDGIGNLLMDFSNHAVQVSVDGKPVSGLRHKITDGKEVKSIQLLTEDHDVAVSVSLKPSLLKTK